MEVIAPTPLPPSETVIMEAAASTEIVSTEVVERAAITEVPTSSPETAAIIDTQPTLAITTEPPIGIVPTTVTRGDGLTVVPMNNSAPLSVGTPIAPPPVAPSATIAVIEPTTAPLDILPTAAPTTIPLQVVSPVPVMAQITGTISTPLAVNLTLTLPDGTTLSAITTGDGTFAFADLQPGSYRLRASADGFLSSQIDFTLTDGQVLALPATLLRPGDTNRDNIVDVRDAVLIAANFGGPATLPETDLNRDGTIDISDLTLLGAAFGQSGPTSWG